MNTLFTLARRSFDWGMLGVVIGIATFALAVVLWLVTLPITLPFSAVRYVWLRRPINRGPYKQGHGMPNIKQQQGRIRMAYAVALFTLGVIVVIANMRISAPVVDASTNSNRSWAEATPNMPATPYIAKLLGFGPGDCRSDGQTGEHFDGRGNSGDAIAYCLVGPGGITITFTPAPKHDERVTTSTPTGTDTVPSITPITPTLGITLTVCPNGNCTTETPVTPTITPTITETATTTPVCIPGSAECPTETPTTTPETPTTTPEIPTSTPSTPEPTQRANCGVGNGVDGDTPGCENGRNDGVGTGPGNPGSAGGNGNGHNQVFFPISLIVAFLRFLFTSKLARKYVANEIRGRDTWL